MNWLFAVVCLFMIFMGFWGYKKGFIKIAYGLAAMILTMVLVSVASPYVQTFIMERTQMYDKLVEVCEERIRTRISDEAESAQEDVEVQVEYILEQSNIKLPLSVGKFVEKMEIQDKYSANLSLKLAAVVANWLIYVFSFIVTFVVVVILLKLVGAILNIASRLPLIKSANKSLGIFMGLMQGLLYIWGLSLILSLFCTTNTGRYLLELVYASKVLQFLYNYNGIIYLTFLFL